MRSRAIAALCVGLGVAAAPIAAAADTTTVTKRKAPAGGVYVLKLDDRNCFTLDRRLHGRRYSFGGCFGGGVLHGESAYNCDTRELAVAGGVDPRVARVLIVLGDGRRVPARLHRARDGRLPFARLIRIHADEIDEMHPAALRAYDAAGTLLGTQEFPRGAARGFNCF